MSIIRVAFLQAFHLRRDAAHVRHGAIGGSRERKQNQFHDDRQQNDRKAPVLSEVVQPLEQQEKRQGYPPQKAVIDGEVQVRCNLLKAPLILWPNVEPSLPG